MGQNSSNPVRNLDKRTARREYRSVFARAIAEYRYADEQLASTGAAGAPAAAPTKTILNWGDSTVRVCARKRPIFKHETDLGEFDCISVTNGGSNRKIIVHDARMHADMRRMMLNNHTFAFDGVFDEHSTNQVVYTNVALPLVREAVQGGYATVLVYGQTGSGKTFTMSSFYEQASLDLFRLSDERFAPPPFVSLNFIELSGDQCFDLLNGFAPVQLLTATDRCVLPFPCVEPTVTCAEDLLALVNHGVAIRSTAATGVHNSSSRSHAILRIFIQKRLESGQFAQEGCLTLVDLAGSEQSIDSMHHTAERRKEGANINSSLLALKECVRSRAERKNSSFHYRKSKLTMALKHGFVSKTAKTVIVATVSPASKDTEHSLNTLRHACMMNVNGEDSAATAADEVGDTPKESRFVTGGTTETVMVGEVDVTALGRQALAAKKAGKQVKDKTSNGNTFGPNVVGKEDAELSDKEKAKMRRQSEARAFKLLDPRLRALLEAHRANLGREERQLFRQRRPPTHFDGEDELEAGAAAAGAAEGQSMPAADVSAHLESAFVGRCSPILRPSSEQETVSVQREQQKLFRKIFKSVYGHDAVPSESFVSNAMQRRQLVTLLKMNGFQLETIERLAPKLDPEVVAHEKASAAQWKADKQTQPTRTFVLNIGNDPGQSSFSTGTPGIRRAASTAPREFNKFEQPPPRPSSSSSSNPSPGLAVAAKHVIDEAAKREKRREDARLIREGMEADRRRKIEASISKKKASLISAAEQAASALAAAAAAAPPPPQAVVGIVSSPPAPTPESRPFFEEGDLDGFVQHLERELQSAYLSSVSRHGLKTQLQVAKAKVLRRDREREKMRHDEELRLAEYQKQDRQIITTGKSDDADSHGEQSSNPQHLVKSLSSLKARISQRRSEAAPKLGTSQHQQEPRQHLQDCLGAAAAPFGNAMNETSCEEE